MHVRRTAASGTIIAFLFVGAICFTAGVLVGQWVSLKPDPSKLSEVESGGAGAPGPAARAAIVDPSAVAYEIVPPVLDFGQMGGGVLDSSVSIRNTGEVPLEVVTIKADCKCTTPGDVAGTVIEVGGALDVPVTMSFGHMAGVRSSRVSVVFRGVEQAVRIPVRGEVTELIRTVPPFANGIGADTGQVMLSALDGRAFNVLAVGGEPPVYTGDAAPAEPAVEHHLVWDLSDIGPDCTEADGNPVRSCILIETDHPDVPLVALRVRHRCLRDVGAATRTWLLLKSYAVAPPARPGDTVEITVPARWLPNRPVGDMPTAVEPVSPGLEARVIASEEVGERFETRIALDVPADARGVTYFEVKLLGATGLAHLEIATVVLDEEGTE